LQILACNQPGAIVALDLRVTNLTGRLPDHLSRLSLRMLNLQGNPGLHGNIPSDTGTQRLVSLSIEDTRINCHDDQLSAAQEGSFTLALQRLSRAQWPQNARTPPQRACVDDALRTYVQPVALRFRSFAVSAKALVGCTVPWLQGTLAPLTSTYVLGIGCACSKGSRLVDTIRADTQDVDSDHVCQTDLYARCAHFAIH
jgi:hypothetical protein